MSNRNIIPVFLSLGLIFSILGCIEPGARNKETSGKTAPVTGGVAIGISPKVIHAERGENISFTVDLSSTENADDRVTININGTWFNKTLTQDIQAKANASVPIHISVPLNAVNMSFKVKAVSRNLNAESSSAGLILINDTER